jgi:hypothetical protein
MQAPCTAATVGLGKLSSARQNPGKVTRGAADAESCPPMSAPAQKCLPAPRNTSIRTAASSANCISAASSASSSAWL